MVLKNALDLSKSIDDYRKDMYELAKNKGISDPDVIKISHQLDEKITMLQKIILKLAPYQQEHLFIRHTNMVEPVSTTHDYLN